MRGERSSRARFLDRSSVVETGRADARGIFFRVTTYTYVIAPDLGDAPVVFAVALVRAVTAVVVGAASGALGVRLGARLQRWRDGA